MLALATRSAFAQADTVAVAAKSLSDNYGLRPEFFDDTNAMDRYLDAQDQDYNALIRISQAFARSAKSMISDLEHDYIDGRVWLDATHYVADFDQARPILQSIIRQAERSAERYHIKEQRRQEQIREQERIRQEQAELKRQEELAQQVDGLRTRVLDQNRTIASICDGIGITDKDKLKELKDIYYSYLMVYNKYNTSSTQASSALYNSLSELDHFQQDLLRDILGDQSYLNQIIRFKDQLKEATSKEFSDIYKSYTRVFRHNTISANFTSLDSYQNYLQRLKDVISVQQAYLQTIETYKAINQTSSQILDLYGKKFKEEAYAYKNVASEFYTVPTFTTLGESRTFLKKLESFQQVQQIYLSNYKRLETIDLRGDSIVQGCLKKNYDIVMAYRELVGSTSFVATFKTQKEAASYAERLDNFEQLQFFYQDIVALRTVISAKEDSILSSKTAERVLVTGYRQIRKGFSDSPRFSTIEQGQRYIDQLYTIINIQNLCLDAADIQERILKEKEHIELQGRTFTNISKAYTRVAKTYIYETPILTAQDLDAYIATLNAHVEAQNIFLQAFSSIDAAQINQRLKRVTEVDKIKLILNIR